jgi:hypothetical protein
MSERARYQQALLWRQHLKLYLIDAMELLIEAKLMTPLSTERIHLDRALHDCAGALREVEHSIQRIKGAA